MVTRSVPPKACPLPLAQLQLKFWFWAGFEGLGVMKGGRADVWQEYEKTSSEVQVWNVAAAPHSWAKMSPVRF